MLISAMTEKHKRSSSTTRSRWAMILASLAIVYVVAPTPFALREAERSLSTHDDDDDESIPNMLLLVLDQWRYDWDGMTPKTPTGALPLKMPFLQEAAKKGTRFTQAYVPSPLCAPVRACLASGKEYDHSGVLSNHGDLWPLEQETFYKLLRDQGNVSIFSCGKDDLHKNDINFPFFSTKGRNVTDAIDLGFTNAMRSAGKTRVTKERENAYDRYRQYLEDTVVGKGAQRVGYDVYKDCHDGYEPFGYATGTWPTDSLCTADKFKSDIYPDDFVAREALALLEVREKKKPWFMQVNFPGPHHPELATAEMAASVADRKWPGPYDAPAGLLACPQKKGVNDGTPHYGGRCNYAAELENLDKLMANITKYLETEKELKNTIVCVVGDHGEMLGDHNLHGKKVPWQASISVPLVCFGPGIKKGAVYQDPVTTLDLGGTFMDFAGVTPNEDMTTQSLRPLLTKGTVPTREFVSSGLEDWRLVVGVVEDVSYKLICCKGPCKLPSLTETAPAVGDWGMLLYNTKDDRFDMNPITDQPEVTAELRKHLPDGWCPVSQPSSS